MENQVYYILSRYDGTGLGNMVDGVYGLFDTLYKAQLEACKHIEALGETLLDWDENPFSGIYNYFSDKGTYHIETMRLNDSWFD